MSVSAAPKAAAPLKHEAAQPRGKEGGVSAAPKAAAPLKPFSGSAATRQAPPIGRAAEFFGLWGLAGKLAAIVGPLSYGLITYLTLGNHRLAMLSTMSFFIAGLILLATVNERRGRAAARDG